MDKTDLSAQSYWDREDLWDAHGGLCQEGIRVSVFTAESAKLIFSKWRRCLWCVNKMLRHSVPLSQVLDLNTYRLHYRVQSGLF